MLLQITCPACGDRLADAPTVTCTDCGNEFHESCADYARTYECSACGDEPWIGAVEF